MLWKLFEESVIIQAVLALLFAGTISYMYITGQEVPESLINLLMLIVGYYFGSKSVVQARKEALKLMKKEE